MSGTIEGGKKAAKTTKKLHGRSFYKHIGAIGGSKQTDKPKGFAAFKANGDIEKIRAAGRLGGKRRWAKAV